MVLAPGGRAAVGRPRRTDLNPTRDLAAGLRAVGLAPEAPPADREHGVAVAAPLEAEQRLVEEHRPSAASSTNLPRDSGEPIVDSKPVSSA
mgnify:CR=1 FL=1